MTSPVRMLYAFITTDADGAEQLLTRAASDLDWPGPRWVTPDADEARRLRRVAARLAVRLRQRVELVVFSDRTTVEVFDPTPEKD